jgi:hypothetical protein
MSYRVQAVYHGGPFVLQELCDIPEDAEALSGTISGLCSFMNHCVRT